MHHRVKLYPHTSHVKSTTMLMHRSANEDGTLALAVIGVYFPHAKKRKAKFMLKNAIRYFLELFIAKPVYSFIVLLLSDQSLEIYLLFTISFEKFESYLNGEIPV